MSVLEKIAFFQNRRDEIPNQILARELADAGDEAGIQEIANNLENKNKNVRSDCLKVLYEIGYISPELIAGHAQSFLNLLDSKENRMVWGAMIALATIANLRPKEIWQRVDDLIRLTGSGTIITQVWGIRALARVAAADPNYEAKIFPFLLDQLRTCLPRDVPTHAESMLVTIRPDNVDGFYAVLESRQSELTPAQMKRYKDILRQLHNK